MSLSVICLACHRDGWCPAHGITNDERFRAWSSRATWREHTDMLSTMEQRAHWRKVAALIEQATREYERTRDDEEREARLCREWDAIGIGGPGR